MREKINRQILEDRKKKRIPLEKNHGFNPVSYEEKFKRMDRMIRSYVIDMLYEEYEDKR